MTSDTNDRASTPAESHQPHAPQADNSQADSDETRVRVRTRSRTRATRDRASGSPTPEEAVGAADAVPSEETVAQTTSGDGGATRRRRTRPRSGGAETPRERSRSRAGSGASEVNDAPSEEAGGPPEADAGEADAGEADAEATAVTPDVSADGPDDGGDEDGGDGTAERRHGTSRSARRRRSRRRARQRRVAARQGDHVDRDRDDRDDSDTADVEDRAPATTEPAAERTTSTPRSRRGKRRTGRYVSTAVSEETRRTIAEGPPRRMLVTEGAERTEIAVLEERDLVEHYVTRKQDASYVGNVYLGRVQNVLPGMEAAFIDIGKGRNGVLYAGEVDFDPADLEGEVPRIEKALKPGQPVLVQVTKDPMGTKGARLTQHLSIAGRFCVLAPGDGMLGISRKLPDAERERLRKILKSVRPEGYGLIVRTAAEGATEEQLEADVSRLVRIWEGVQRRAQTVKPLEPVYEEPSLVIRVIRDIFGPEYTDLIIDSAELAERVRDYLGDVSPEMVDRVSVHTGEPLFDAYEVTNQVRRALEKKVWLASGGYLIIEKTEAMWVIDVNTGRFVGKSNLEETVLKNNLEAAEEIAKQLRLRDMGGIIVIDFVDMMVPANRDEVLKRFKRELARDKTKSRVMEISKLGLVQMTRKNVSQGLTETFTTPCDCCDGRGARIIEALW